VRSDRLDRAKMNNGRSPEARSGSRLDAFAWHSDRTCAVCLEYFFAVCGALTLERGPISWVATHRLHHQHSDRAKDPHSPRHGAWWSHAGWILTGEAVHNNTRLTAKYAPDLAKHRFYLWLNNYHWVPMIVLGLLLQLIGGLPLLLWGICFRVVFGLHARGSLIQRHICGGGAASQRTMIPATTGGSLC
jgi:fatty-acid desaturase